MKAIFCFEITDGPNGKTERWVIDLKNGSGSIKRGANAGMYFTCTFHINDIN